MALSGTARRDHGQPQAAVRGIVETRWIILISWHNHLDLFYMATSLLESERSLPTLRGRY